MKNYYRGGDTDINFGRTSLIIGKKKPWKLLSLKIFLGEKESRCINMFFGENIRCNHYFRVRNFQFPLLIDKTVRFIRKKHSLKILVADQKKQVMTRLKNYLAYEKLAPVEKLYIKTCAGTTRYTQKLSETFVFIFSKYTFNLLTITPPKIFP